MSVLGGGFDTETGHLSTCPVQLRYEEGRRSVPKEKEYEINKVFLYSPQDPTVGMVSLEIDLQGYEVYGEEELEWVRETLANCFGALYDDKVYVTFDFEEVP